LLALLFPLTGCQNRPQPFSVEEASIATIHAAYESGQLTSRQLVQLYLDRIEAYDRSGPMINSIITVNPRALEEADRLDAALGTSGFVGPLHGIPVLLKDMIDAEGMPTTMGSILFKDYYPDRDALVVEKLKRAGAIILAKVTLAEFARGDTYGSLFGETRNPYDVARTVGGSSGGSAASVSANFGTVAVGQEGFASIRRPSAWNSIVGMRPTTGLVAGGLGPMTRTVEDAAKLLDVLVGYDPADPQSAFGVGEVPTGGYAQFLDSTGLQGARLGVLRQPMGVDSEPGSDDFRRVTEVFDRAIGELRAAGAEVVDPITIPNLATLLATRANRPGGGGGGFGGYNGANATAPFASRAEMEASPDYQQVFPWVRERVAAPEPDYYEFLLAREDLRTSLAKLMADHRLDAIVYKSVEHQPLLIAEGTRPPYPNMRGTPHLNTFLANAPAVSVPAGFSTDGLPVGITFQGRPYAEGALLTLAYAYEQATRHRTPPMLEGRSQ
jgi:Asp-tRNA(Asn)/Glu-tRNA(Gln) amidotransferase A subunit family amidase